MDIATLKTVVELTFVIYLFLELSPINVCHYFVFSITHVAWLRSLQKGVYEVGSDYVLNKMSAYTVK